MSRKLRRRDERVFQSFSQLLLEMLARIAVELSPFLQGGLYEAEFIAH
jgi:hypothetical protein